MLQFVSHWHKLLDISLRRPRANSNLIGHGADTCVEPVPPGSKDWCGHLVVSILKCLQHQISIPTKPFIKIQQQKNTTVGWHTYIINLSYLQQHVDIPTSIGHTYNSSLSYLQHQLVISTTLNRHTHKPICHTYTTNLSHYNTKSSTDNLHIYKLSYLQQQVRKQPTPCCNYNGKLSYIKN